MDHLFRCISYTKMGDVPGFHVFFWGYIFISFTPPFLPQTSPFFYSFRFPKKKPSRPFGKKKSSGTERNNGRSSSGSRGGKGGGWLENWMFPRNRVVLKPPNHPIKNEGFFPLIINHHPFLVVFRPIFWKQPKCLETHFFGK